MKVEKSLHILGGALVGWLAADGALASGKFTENGAHGFSFDVSVVLF